MRLSEQTAQHAQHAMYFYYTLTGSNSFSDYNNIFTSGGSRFVYYSGYRKSDNVNHDAHLFGSLFGIVFTILIRPVVVVEFFERVKNFDLHEFQFLFINF